MCFFAWQLEGLVAAGHHVIRKIFRCIAPGLAHQISHQRIADDAAGKWFSVSGFFPLCTQVPVVGDVVVVEHHGHWNVCHQAVHTVQFGDEFLHGFQLCLIAFCELGRHINRNGHLGVAPRNGRPNQEVHGHDFGQGYEVISSAVGGEYRFFYTRKQHGANVFVGLGFWQQLVAGVIVWLLAMQGIAIVQFGGGQRLCGRI